MCTLSLGQSVRECLREHDRVSSVKLADWYLSTRGAAFADSLNLINVKRMHSSLFIPVRIQLAG